MSQTHDDQGRIIRYGPYPELTAPAVIVGYILGAVICISIGYAALILGFSIEGSELAAILGWGILRGIMKRTSIIENNINQTIASAVNGASAGMMFSVPALYILAKQNPEKYGGVTEFSYPLLILACITGGILGLAFIIPLRKQMIDFNRLAYPGGIAVAAILKSPGAGMRKAALLLIGATVSGGFYLAMMLTLGEHPETHVGQRLGLPSFLNLTFFMSLMTVGVGYIAGKGGLVFGYGGFICYFLLAPMLSQWGEPAVKDMINPPARVAIVTADNKDTVTEAADILRPHDAALAEGLDSLTTQEGLFDAQAAQTIVQAAEALNVIPAYEVVLTAESESTAADADADADNNVETSDSDQPTTKIIDPAQIAQALLDTTQAQSILDAMAVLSEQGDTLQTEILAQTSARGVYETIQQSGLSPEQQATLQKATHAEETYYGVPDPLRLKLFRPTGIGILIGAAIGGIIAAFPLIRSALKSMQQAAAERARGGGGVSDELSIRLLYAGVAGGAVMLVFISLFSVPGMELWRAVAMALLGTLWIWIAGVIVSECLGRTNWSPLSGMTLIAVTILILISSGLGSERAIMSSVIIGAAICVAIAQAGDMMLDLKSGYLVGAQPKMQQIGQVLGSWLGPILTLGLILILAQSYEFGGEHLPAPQGAALASMINGIVGGEVPQWRYAAGGGLGLLLAFSGLGGVGVQIGLGFYMPFNIVLTYTIGCVARIITQRMRGMRFVENVGIPLAAGLIVGEALVGVGNAMYRVFGAGAGG